MQAWFGSVRKTLYVVDAILMLMFIVTMSVHATGIPVHEWVSFVFLIPFVVHLLFHWDWITRMPLRLFGVLRGEARFNVVWDFFLYVLMTFAIISGILASEVALPALGFEFHPDPFWARTHHNYSNFLFPLLGVHLATHWRWIVDVTRQFSKRNRNKSTEDVA